MIFGTLARGDPVRAALVHMPITFFINLMPEFEVRDGGALFLLLLYEREFFNIWFQP